MKQILEVLDLFTRETFVNSRSISDALGVSIRASQKYIQELKELDFIIDAGQRNYQLNSRRFGNSETPGLKVFADKMGGRQVFGNHLDSVLRNIELPEFSINRSKGFDIEKRGAFFEDLDKAVQQHRKVSFKYRDKKYTDLPAYKLLYLQDMWYLGALDKDVPKKFSIDKIRSLQISTDTYMQDPRVLDVYNNMKTPWAGGEERFVFSVLSSDIAYYFFRGIQIDGQKRLETDIDGKPAFECYTGEPSFRAFYQSWIPHIKIIEPRDYAATVHTVLREFIDREEEV